MLQSLDHLYGPLLNLFQCVRVFLVLRSPDLEPALHVCFTRAGSASLAASPALPNAAKETVSFLCFKGTFLAYVQFGVHQDPQGLFCKATFQLADPSLYWCGGLFLVMSKTWHCPLLNFMRLMKFTWSRGNLAKCLFIMHRKHVSVHLLLYIPMVNKLIANLRDIF